MTNPYTLIQELVVLPECYLPFLQLTGTPGENNHLFKKRQRKKRHENNDSRTRLKLIRLNATNLVTILQKRRKYLRNKPTCNVLSLKTQFIHLNFLTLTLMIIWTQRSSITKNASFLVSKETRNCGIPVFYVQALTPFHLYWLRQIPIPWRCDFCN
ncbi:hypothetical protein AVEN_90876-1 [Araneus ventricosus]|uniref:Uncharacterized protein n=1 Tax=Araneus ventricosus TaxID=182803 RepID=A0A4Y2P4X8_ARAVE|nr:hypothetical protein AVEN_90876-1 [Araneus ventricosus]